MKLTDAILATAVLAALVAFLPEDAHAADISELTAECDTCHGKDGASTDSDTPIIGGLSDFFIEEAMFIYRDRARPCVEEAYPEGPKKGEKTDMCQIADALSEEEITALAEHYANLPFVPVEQPFDAAKAETGAALHERHCEKCHAAAGSDPFDDAGLLAGQHSEYLRQSLEHFMNGERDTDEKMLEKLDELSDEDIEALLDFWASKHDIYNK